MKKQAFSVITFLIALFVFPVCVNAQTSDVGMLSIFDMFDWTSTENDVVSFFEQLPDSNISVTYDQNGRCISVKITSSEKYEMYYFHVTKEYGRVWGIEGFSQRADCCEHTYIYIVERKHRDARRQRPHTQSRPYTRLSDAVGV